MIGGIASGKSLVCDQLRQLGATVIAAASSAEKLEKLREQNDGFGLNEIQTAQVRGQIKCLRDLIALEEPPPFQDDGNTNQHTATRAGLE